MTITVFNPHRVGHDRKANAGIAGRSLHDRAAGLELAPRHRVLDDEQRRPVLDRLPRIHELGLAENGAAGDLRCFPQLDQRRVADGGDDVGLDVHGS